MKEFLREVVDTARKTAEELINKLDEFVTDAERPWETEHENELAKTKAELQQLQLRNDALVKSNENLKFAVDSQQEILADYELALKLFLDGEVNKRFFATQEKVNVLNDWTLAVDRVRYEDKVFVYLDQYFD